MRPTRKPRAANPAARFAVMVLLPTPPLPLAMATMCFTPGSTLRTLARSPLNGLTVTSTLSSLPSACFKLKTTASSMRLRLCMAGLLTSTFTWMVFPSIRMSRTRSSVTMSFFRSGSMMRASTARACSRVMVMAMGARK